MKELSIEEKAKAYDEAIRKLRGMIPNWERLSYNGKTFLQDLIYILPELKESEDERIRKELTQNLKERFGTRGSMGGNLDMPRVLAWLEKQGKKDEEILILKDQIESLHAAIKAIKETHRIELEKQGEQKPTDKIEPKFKVGNKIKLAKEPKYPAREIIAIRNDAYYFDERVYLPFSRQDEWELVEQKPADKVEPKFKAGDWVVVNDGRIGRIIECTKDFADVDLEFSCLSTSPNNIRSWKIQDAKEGDILCTYVCDEPKIVFILKGTPNIHYALDYHCYYNIMYPHFESDSEKGCLSPNDEDVKPATKEQRGVLMKAIADAGYTFDFEKKELKKVEQKPADKIEPRFKVGDIVKHKDNPHLTYVLKRFTDDGDYEFHAIGKDGNEGETCFAVIKYQDDWELVGQKPAFEMKTPEESLGIDSDTYSKIVDECVYGEQKPAWSEEDEKVTKWVIDYIGNCPNESFDFYGGVGKEAVLSWLNKLKDIKLKDILQLQPKQEWSEEDEENLKWFEKFFRAESVIAEGMDIPQDRYLWFKNLKGRVQLQNTWKPSDGQLECLGYAIGKAKKDWSPLTNNRIYLTLKALKEQLKKLRDE